MKRVIVSLVSAAIFCAAANAQITGVSGSIGMDYLFDNNEFAPSDDAFVSSRTIQYVRVTPRVDFEMFSRKTQHKLVLGVDLFHNMGDNPYSAKDIFGETPVYYHVFHKADKGTFRASVGVYPRSELKGYYSNAIVSEYLREQDFYLEGACLSWKQKHLYAELALDWMGAKDQARKERFQVLSSGLWSPLKELEFGWNLSFYHYAGSVEAPGVAEVITGIPYVKVNAPKTLFWDKLYLRAGAIASYQRDRVRDHQWKELTPDAPVRPYLQQLLSPEFTLHLKRGAFSWTQVAWMGEDLLPFYDLTDTAGHPFADMLYRGSAMYRGGSYTLTELYWNPRINRWLDFKLGMRYHFGAEGYRGCQQLASLRINIDRIYEKKY